MHRLLLGLTACPKPTPAGDGAAGDPAGDPATVPAGAVDPGQGAASDPTPSTVDGCLRNEDCDSGVCEGQGCGDDQPGTCAAPDRMCTRDAALYCGCDGQPFRASGSCPGQRYASKGECGDAAATGPGVGADGTPCRAASDCASGVCEGEGCGDDQPGTCMAAARSCTRDYQTYCGCDGQTFKGSGSCPGQRYANRGECSSGGA